MLRSYTFACVLEKAVLNWQEETNSQPGLGALGLKAWRETGIAQLGIASNGQCARKWAFRSNLNVLRLSDAALWLSYALTVQELITTIDGSEQSASGVESLHEVRQIWVIYFVRDSALRLYSQ